ncbi:sugar ABC transporter permease [Alicyclobacillus mengziensis]|uniref:Sugar ABC transporter permease n=1 Tax=Alicyclobacillus mengziensis TaxID=2931921 RepID=A0A9X7W489_9BACL|nr:sugar ABC transporter permease [Alicyclobacillus mengziensis]QSO49238.1 sugar ABC transporter permease [Alicyclobacillus mengziensis]
MIQTVEQPEKSTRIKPKVKRKGLERAAPYLFLSPWIIGLIVFSVGPILLSLYFSFTNFNLLQPPQWIGFQNYKNIFTNDTLFYTSLRVTFLYLLMAVPIKLIVALAIAMLLAKNIRGIGFYRAIYYIPSLIGTSVAVAYLWQQIFGQSGLINKALLLFGIHGPAWIDSPSTALFTLSLLQAWSFGSSMLIFLAGLKAIPDSLYEAAKIDGANRWQQFLRVTVPLLSPVVFFNLIMTIINSFTQFTQGFIVTDGGPINSTLFYALYLYNQFSFFKMGYASALAWILLIIIAVFTSIVFMTSKRWVYYES